jgi:nitrate/nitrite-specific signal transduction histidine kinase
MLVAGGVSLYLGIRVYQINRAYEQEYAHARTNDEIYVTFQRIISEIQHIQGTGEFERVDRLRDLRASLTRTLKTFVDFHRKEARSPDEALETPLVDKLSRIETDLVDLSDRIATKLELRTYLDPVELSQLRNIVDQGAETTQDLRQFHSMRVVRMSEESQSLIRRNVTLYLAFLVFGGLLVGLASLVFHRKIGAPLVRLAGAALGIAQGRLDERVPVPTRDEMGQLSHAFNVMADRLQERERDLRTARDGLEKKVQELEVLNQIGAGLLAASDLDTVLRMVIDKTRELLSVDAAALCLATPDPEELRVRATSGPAEAFLAEADSVRRSTRTPGQPQHPLTDCPVMHPSYVRSHLAMPLKHKGAAIGVICVGSRGQRAFSVEDTEMLFALAAQAAIAVDHARLDVEVQRLAQLEERGRIAREMHDGLAQNVGLLHMKIKQAQSLVASGEPARMADALAEMATITESAYEEVRQSIYGLRTTVTRGLGLVPKLTELLHDFSDRHGISVELEASDNLSLRLQPVTEAQLVRIIQEALANVRKHAQASRAWVRLQSHDDHLRVSIEDDGRGWDPAAVPEPSSQHLGLTIMRERAESLGGTLEIETGPGRGARVTVVLPPERTA